MTRQTTIIGLTLLTLIAFSCGDKKSIDNQKWYDETKAEILRQSNLKADSTTYTYDDDSIFRQMHLFYNGHEFYKRNFKYLWSKGGAITFYSKNGDFGLMREICDNDSILFEGILYKGQFYGLSSWWKYCDKRLPATQGIRYKDKKVGVWKDWDDNGKIVETDYKNLDKVDLMPTIEKE